jgi:hypothetical protein
MDMAYQLKRPWSLKPILFFYFWGFISSTSGLLGQVVTVDVTGSWSLTIDQTNLQAGAGSDLVSSYESATNQVMIDINKVVYGNFWDWLIAYNWRVDVRRSDALWDSRLNLDVRRTGNGTGMGTISGGTAYQAVSSMDQTFFSGSRRRYDIPVQLQLRNVSIDVPPNNYSTTVVYTVTEL